MLMSKTGIVEAIIIVLCAWLASISMARATVCDNNGNCASSPSVPQYYAAPPPASGPISVTATAKMVCIPHGGQAYTVKVSQASDGSQLSSVTSSHGRTTFYAIQGTTNDQQKHVIYARVRNATQSRTLFLAFDYSNRGRDVSSLRAVGDDGSDSSDKCAFVN